MENFRAMEKYVGRKAARYDERRGQRAATHQDQAIVESFIAQLEPGASILDMPAGTGRFLQPCAARGLRYTGVDISADMLEIARGKIPAGATHVELQVADARSLPYPDDSFDYAIVVKFIKWLPTTENLTEVLVELGRVVRKQAFVQITVSPEKWWRPLLGLARRSGNGASQASDGSRSRAFSREELKRAFFEAGLHVCSVAAARKGWLGRRRVRFYVLSKEHRKEQES